MTGMTVTEKTARSVTDFMDDPISFFGQSYTQMHSIDRGELEALQRQAMGIRFQQHRVSIEMLRKLADRLGITALNDFNDVVPLFFSHTAFKSYPAVLVDKKRFDLMTKWLDKLTSYDLSDVDTAGCTGIDDWIDRLDAQTPLEVITSSGTTGTISILPKDKHGAVQGMTLWKICLFQTFGQEPTEAELNPVVDVVWPNFANGKLGHLRIANMIKRGFTGGDESKFHALYPGAVDTDLMFLASKMRAAASRGELDRLEVDPALAARKDEFIAMQARQVQDLEAFFSRLTDQLRGKRVFMTSAFHQMYDIAKAGLDRGVRNVFAPDSAILTGGGMKGVVLPDDFMEVIKDFLGVDRIQVGYGFSESSTFHWGCSEGRYHVAPWVIPFVLDPETSEPLPRTGVQTGRAAVYDILLRAHWGGVISGDEVTINWDLKCPCGQASVAFEPEIMRYSEKQGVEDDRITCAATHEVHNEAVNFMKGLDCDRLHRPTVPTGRGHHRGHGSLRYPRRRRTVPGAGHEQVCRATAAQEPAEMSDLYELSFDEILDVLEALGDALDFDTNTHLQEAYEASLVANVLPPEMIQNSYRVLRPLFSRDNVTEIADSQVGLDYLNGWVPHTLHDGRELRVRAFGSRVLHIPAGNGGLVSAVTILRSVITRSDVIIKAPSKDPLPRSPSPARWLMSRRTTRSPGIWRSDIGKAAIWLSRKPSTNLSTSKRLWRGAGWRRSST